jgi:hypothetical protein
MSLPESLSTNASHKQPQISAVERRYLNLRLSAHISGCFWYDGLSVAPPIASHLTRSASKTAPLTKL